jgi:erythritol/L-threitol dehydrogenase
MTEHTEMQAVVNHGPKDYRLERVPRPTAGPREVIIRVDAAGICGSDAKCYAGGEMFWGGADPWVKAPVVPGHEFFGTVVELGDGAEQHHGVSLGEKAIAEQIRPCDRCRFCERGQYWMCQVHDIHGFQGEVADGAWAQFMRFGSTARVHRMPDDISDEAGVLVEPLACAIHGVNRADVQLGDTVVLAGAGPIGLLMLQVLRLRSPRTIIVSDARADRLELAAQLGADVTVDVSQTDLDTVVRQLTDGYGCDVFIEATGHPSAVEQGLQVLRRLGRMVVYGVFGAPTTVDWSVIGDRKELDVLGAHLGPYSYPTAIAYLADGTIDAGRLVTHRYPLEEFDEALQVVRDGTGIKVMLQPSLDA